MGTKIYYFGIDKDEMNKDPSSANNFNFEINSEVQCLCHLV